MKNLRLLIFNIGVLSLVSHRDIKSVVFCGSKEIIKNLIVLAFEPGLLLIKYAPAVLYSNVYKYMVIDYLNK